MSFTFSTMDTDEYDQQQAEFSPYAELFAAIDALPFGRLIKIETTSKELEHIRSAVWKRDTLLDPDYDLYADVDRQGNTDYHKNDARPVILIIKKLKRREITFKPRRGVLAARIRELAEQLRECQEGNVNK